MERGILMPEDPSLIRPIDHIIVFNRFFVFAGRSGLRAGRIGLSAGRLRLGAGRLALGADAR